MHIKSIHNTREYTKITIKKIINNFQKILRNRPSKKIQKRRKKPLRMKQIKKKNKK